MKRTGFLLIMMIFSAALTGQDLDGMLTAKKYDCSDISYNSGDWFVKYMKKNDVDSARQILNYWESKCGMREPVFRAEILLALKENRLNDSLFPQGSLNYILNYEYRAEMIKYANYQHYDDYKSYFGYIPPGQEFDQYTRELAGELKKNFDPLSTEYLMAEFYSDNSDTLLYKLQSDEYQRFELTKEYEEVVDTYANRAEYHMSLVTGIWIPTGDLKKLGCHPEFGFQIGAKHKKMNYDVILAIRFLNSANEYYAQRPDSDLPPELTDHYLGAHIGFDVGRDLLAKKGHEIQLTGGIAMDGFDALEDDKEKDLENASIWSYDFNIGLGYRYYFTNSFYLGLRAKYHVVDYTRGNIIDFTGNPITIQFIIGTVNGEARNANLKAMKYKLRK